MVLARAGKTSSAPIVLALVFVAMLGTIAASAAPAAAAGLTVTASVAFGNVDFGVTGATSVAKSVKITNPASGQLVTGLTVQIEGIDPGDFTITNDGCGSTLAKGTNCTVMLTFTPAALGTRNASLAVSDTANANAGSAALSGVGAPGKLTITPLTSNFGNIVVGAASAAKTTTLRNLTAATMEITSVTPSGAFAIASDGCSGNDLAPSATCAISVTFSPTQTGALSGNVSIADDAANSPQSVTLEGTGILANPAFSPTSLAFGRVQVGSVSATKSVTITNPNAVALAVSSITVPAPFEKVADSCEPSISAGANCQVSVTFNPTTDTSPTGTAETAKLTIADNGKTASQTVNLSGTAFGVVPTPTATATATATPTATTTTTATPTATATSTANSIPVTVRGGLNPVVGAQVILYGVGTAYGANATSLGVGTTSASGELTVRFTPPATPEVLYLVALNGDALVGPMTPSNGAIGLMGVVGMSNAIPPSVTINELTTVAGEWALAQFTDSTGQIIGAPSSNATGLANAVNQAQANLADIVSGGPASFWANGNSNQNVNEANCTGGSPPVNCDGLERMDTIANILAACMESSGPSSAACSTLLSNTGGGTTTLAAAHAMATNPVASVGTLFALQGGSPPFTPALSGAPDGWEIALNFAPSGANFSEPFGLAIDAAGNVWVANEVGDSVTELTSSGGLAGNFNNTNTTGANFNTPLGVAIDGAGNVWVTNQGGNSVTELTSSGSLAGNFAPSGANFDDPSGVAIDAAGNAWVTNVSDSVTELTSSGGLAGNFAPSGANLYFPISLAIDAAGNIWVADLGDNVTELTSSGGLAGNFNNTNASGANFNTPWGVAIDAAGNVWVTNQGGNSVTELTSSGSLAGNFNNTNTSGANFNTPTNVAIDAAGNVWVVNQGGNSVTELTSSGSLAGNFAPAGAHFNDPSGVAIDAAGNVWVANGFGVAEVVGAASPVLTPLVGCLTQATPHAVCLP